MLTNPFSQTLFFLVTVLFNLYLWVIILRFLLQVVRADFFNPLSQLVIKLTNPLVTPLKKILPFKKGVDYASLVLILIVELIKIVLLTFLTHVNLSLVGIIVTLLADTAKQFLNIYFYLIIVVAIASWFMRDKHHPALNAIIKITEPVLRIARKIIPTIGGFDFSPIVVLLLIQVIELLVVYPLLGMGASV